MQNKNAIAACTKEERKIRNPEPFLSHFGPEKVPGFVLFAGAGPFCCPACGGAVLFESCTAHHEKSPQTEWSGGIFLGRHSYALGTAG